VKKTQESGSAFRPAREADMMRRLVERHKGILPLDTAEGIWRVIIATFTYVQAPFSVHADLSAGDALMRDSARFHFGFTVPFVAHVGAASVVESVSESKGDLGLVPAFAGAGAWWTALEFDTAPKIIARLPFVERANHPAALPVFVVSRVAADAMVTEVEMWSVRVSGWSAAAARGADRGARPRLRRRCLADLGRKRRNRCHLRGAAQDRRLDPLRGPRRQPREALYGGLTFPPPHCGGGAARSARMGARGRDACASQPPPPRYARSPSTASRWRIRKGL